MQPVTQYVDCPNPDGKGTHKLALHRWGDEKNPRTLICAHGMTRNGRDFDFLAQALQENYRIFCPDMPGRGESEWLKDPALYAYPTYVGDMFFVLQSLKLTQVDWVGTSMGGLIGMFVAAAAPQMIRKLVINDIGPLIPKASLERLATYVGEIKYFKDEAEATAYARIIYGPWGIKDDAHLKHLVQHSLKQTEKGLTFSYDPNIGQTFRNPDGTPKVLEDIVLWEAWEKVVCPVLLLRGGVSDILPAEVAAKMWQVHPDLDYVEYPGIGHAPALMEEEQIGKIKEFLLA